MTLRDVRTGEEKESYIDKVGSADFKSIKKNKEQFRRFDWNKCRDKEVYKLQLMNSDAILGLMCIFDHFDPSINAIEIELLEVGNENIGPGKKLDKIAGCLIAYACRESFKRGHDGFVFLTPKTELITHYASKYGMKYWPPLGLQLEGHMIIEERQSRELIKQYL
jgi:hypothetical protein